MTALTARLLEGTDYSSGKPVHVPDHDPVKDRSIAYAQKWAASNNIKLSGIRVIGSWEKRRDPKDIDLIADASASPHKLHYPWHLEGGFPVDLFLRFDGKVYAPVGGAGNGATMLPVTMNEALEGWKYEVTGERFAVETYGDETEHTEEFKYVALVSRNTRDDERPWRITFWGNGEVLHVPLDDPNDVYDDYVREGITDDVKDVIDPHIIYMELVPCDSVDAKADRRVGLALESFISLVESPQMDTLKKNKVKITDEERNQIMKAKAVWHHGPNGEETPAVWKSVVDGKTWYVTNTHRCYAAKKTLKAAINAYHRTVEPSA